jgi:ubiquinol-cytochrome c reductase cytochrome b subunit
MNALLRWLDARTGYQQILHYLLDESIPGGSRWRYVWGSALMFTVAVQVITGIFLAMAYSPNTQSAWASVYYIQYQMPGGALLRGLHHFCAQLMILLLGAHLLQVVWDRAYTAPREINFWFGLALLHLTLAISLTGYLLPWDQKGFWATKVATNIFGTAPVFGPAIQKLLMGGSDYGHHTLTRFYALHAGVLPMMLFAAVGAHIYLFRRHGIKAKRPFRTTDQMFWPDQVLKDAVAACAVLATVLVLIYRNNLFHGDGMTGAELGAPADPTEPYSAARPEWYFLFMFQFLKLFPGGTEVWGAIIIPNLVLVTLLLMPFIAIWRFGHKLNLAWLGCLILGIGLLTWTAKEQDRKDPAFQRAVADARSAAERAVLLAQTAGGVPAEGGLAMLQADPLTQGPRLFARNCASCHRYDGHDGMGRKIEEPPTASDLKGFGSREWITGLLDPKQISEPHYFGGTKFKNGKMAKFVKLKIARLTDEDKTNLTFVVAAISAEAALKSQRAADVDSGLIESGRDLFKNKLGCSDCHKFRDADTEGTAPTLTGYGSRGWIMSMMNNPANERFYGKNNDRMPAFGAQEILDAQSMGVIADWLRGDFVESKPGLAER